MPLRPPHQSRRDFAPGRAAPRAAARAAAWAAVGFGAPLVVAAPLRGQLAPPQAVGHGPARDASLGASHVASRSARVFRLTSAGAALDTLPAPLRRRVTVRLSGVTVERALRDVVAYSGLSLSYSGAVVPLARVVSVDVTDVPVLDALRQILPDAAVEVWVSPEGRMALVPAARAGGADLSGRDAAAGGVVAGRVTVPGGVPLAGAAVRVQGTTLGATAGADGRFTITGVPGGPHTVVAQRIGYARDSASVTVAVGRSARADFALRQAAAQLQEVVAIGYGSAARRDLTGAVAVVPGEELTTPAAPTTALSSALQGRAAGVQVINNSGLPGGGARVRIRGTGSITANAEPLYVIDGLPAVQGTGSDNPQDNPLMSVDPSEIASVEVLKDASATAIYGARGANGVVLVTTRRGQQGADRVTVAAGVGTQRSASKIDVLNAPQFMQLVNEARANAGLAPGYTGAEIAGAHTYDYPAMMLRAASQADQTVTFSGGGGRVRYLAGGNYTGQRGIVIGSSLRRYAGRLNLDGDVGRRLRVGTSLSLTRVARDAADVEAGSLGNEANGLQAALQFDPSQAPRDSTGAWVKTAGTAEPVPNPVANATDLTDRYTTARLLGSAYAEYNVLPSLALRATLGGSYQKGRVHYFAPPTILAGGLGGVVFLQSAEARNLASENTLTYRGAVGPGALTALGGFSVQRFRTAAVRDADVPVGMTTVFDLGSGSQLLPSERPLAESAILSYLGRVGYDLADRYLVTLTARRDGSSRFGANNKWATFPSAALAWRVSREGFMRGQQLFGDLKLRVGYGRVGNQAVDPYQSRAALGTVWYGFGGTEVPALAPQRTMPNPNLRWERKTSFNVGLDATLLRDRVTLAFDAYRDRTGDLLLSVPLPRTTGYTQQLQNVGAVRNRGLELSVSTVNVARGRFGWRSTLAVAGNRNRVLSLGPQDSLFVSARGGGYFDPEATHIVKRGEPLGAIYGFAVDGLWQRGDACTLKAARDCTPGEYKVRDLDGDGQITAADRTVLGYSDPKVYGGVGNEVTLGPLSLGAFVNFVRGNKIINAGAAFGTLATGQVNERTAVLNRWTPRHPNTAVPRANLARPRRLYSTLVEDGSYLRLQTVTVGYELPKSLVPRARAARLFVTGQNLWVATRYRGFDPDVNGGGGDARIGGVDVGAYPRQRAWNVGLHATF